MRVTWTETSSIPVLLLVACGTTPIVREAPVAVDGELEAAITRRAESQLGPFVVYPSRGGEDEVRAEPGECDAGKPLDRGHVRLDGDIREVRLVACVAESECRWKLAARNAAGWFGSYDIGDSAAGCKRPSGAQGSWFPEHITATAGVVSVTGRRWPYLDGLDDEGTECAPVPEPVVIRCRVDREGLACVERRADVDVTVGDIGGRVAATWLALPGTLAATRGAGGFAMQHWRVPFGAGWLAVSNLLAATVTWQPRAGTSADVALSDLPTQESEAFEADVRLVADGVVQVAGTYTYVSTNVVVVWSWDELFVPASEAREALRVRIITGIQIRPPEPDPYYDAPPPEELATIAGWQRVVEVVPGGVRMVELDGPLAPFRGTGTFTWEDLRAEIPRWRRLGARLVETELARLRAERGPPPPPPRDLRELILANHGPLDLLPGYVEPIGAEVAARDWLDDITTMRLDDEAGSGGRLRLGRRPSCVPREPAYETITIVVTGGPE